MRFVFGSGREETQVLAAKHDLHLHRRRVGTTAVTSSRCGDGLRLIGFKSCSFFPLILVIWGLGIDQERPGWYHYEKLTDLLGDGIFSVDGEKWLHQRKVASYEIGTKTVRDFSLEVFKSNAVKLTVVVSKTAMSNNAVDFQTLDTIYGTYEEGTQFSNAFDEASATLYQYVDVLSKIKRFLNNGS
ncbi:hypothetical protein V8G54_011201 [Vigna mungo]|uniref:Uncharacterized protein n=1 Tax=Vigna mungo TaxID=3915 RepID=A0AAQ3NND1_VIGMU